MIDLSRRDVLRSLTSIVALSLVRPLAAFAQTETAWADLSTAWLAGPPVVRAGGPQQHLRHCALEPCDLSVFLITSSNPTATIAEKHGAWGSLGTKPYGTMLRSTVLLRHCDGTERNAVPECQEDDGLPSILVRHGAVTSGYMTAVSFRIAGAAWDGTAPFYAFAIGSGRFPSPPRLAFADARPRLVMPFAGIVGAQTPTYYPAGYTAVQAAPGKRSTALAAQVVDAAAVQPSPFEFPLSGSWIAGVLAISPREVL